jgi:hypothetical protein
MRRPIVIVFVLAPLAGIAQESAPPSAPEVLRTEIVDIAPLAPPDLTSPYASPRDAARHRLQTAITELTETRDIKAGLRNFAEAWATDRSYAPAVFDLAVLAAVAGRWKESIAAFTQTAKLTDGELRRAAEMQIERLTLVDRLESTPQGRRDRQYDQTLYLLLDKLPKMQQPDAFTALVELGKIDPKRWEAPALIAGLYGDRQGYDAAARFLEIALPNASDARVKAGLQKALDAARKELRFTAAQAAAEVAAENGEFAKAAELYESAWKEIPARPSNGLNAASSWLLDDNIEKSSVVLAVLKTSPDADLAARAKAMLAFLEPVDAKAANVPANSSFLRDPGPAEPVRLSPLLPQIDKQRMAILVRPLPRLIEDKDPVALLESFAADAPAGAQPMLPAIPASRFTVEGFWRELNEQGRATSATPEAKEPALSSAVLAQSPGTRVLAISSTPAGARVFVGAALESPCQTPCELRAAAGTYAIRAALPGYEEEIQAVRLISRRGEVNFTLKSVRGYVTLSTGTPAAVRLNATPLLASLPAQLALIPGLYRFTAQAAERTDERTLNVRAGARLKVVLLRDAAAAGQSSEGQK